MNVAPRFNRTSTLLASLVSLLLPLPGVAQTPESAEPAPSPAPAVPETPPKAPEVAPTPVTPEPSYAPQTQAPAEPDLPPPTEGEGAELDLFRLDAVLNAPVVTASGTKQESSTAAANVYSIGKEEIARRGFRSLAEIIARAPGLYVVEDAVMPSVGVRGVTGGLRAGSRIVRVMIDGVAVNFRPDLTAFLGPEYIPVEAIERVEIVRGPLSALYGANAFLATVNVITKVPEKPHAEVQARGVSVMKNFGAGTSAIATYGEAKKGFLAAFSADRIDRSGNRVEKTFDSQRPDDVLYADIFKQKSQDDLAQPMAGFAKVYQEFDDVGKVTLQGGVQRLDSNAEFQLNSAQSHQSRVALENYWTNGEFFRKWSEVVSSTLSLGWSRGLPSRDERFFLTGTQASYFERNFGYWAADGKAEVTIDPIQQLSLKVGVDGEWDQENVLFYTQISSDPFGTATSGVREELIGDTDNRGERLYDLGAYLQANGTPISSLTDLQLTGNFRVDKIEQGKQSLPPQISWRGAVVYRWNPDVVTKLIAGQAFQTPSGVMLFAHGGFGPSNNVAGKMNLPGVKALTPQTVRSVEAVASARLLGHLGLEGGVYVQEIKDQIVFVRSGSDFVAQNQGAAQNGGIEATARMSFGRYQPYLSASAFKRFSENDTLGKPVKDDLSLPAASYPNFFGLGGIDVELKEVYLLANAEVRGVTARGSTASNKALNNAKPYQLPGYVDLDATLSTTGLHPLGADQETTVVAGVRNILDERHSEPGFGGYDIPTMGRMIFVQLRQSY